MVCLFGGGREWEMSEFGEADFEAFESVPRAVRVACGMDRSAAANPDCD